MAFKRENCKSLVSTRKEYFASSYGFTKKTGFNFGSDVYVIPLGLDTGFYETPCHRVLTHKVDGKTVGFNGSSFPTYIRCQGITEDGSVQSSLCCTLAQLERDRIPEKTESGKRIISGLTWRVHIPVLILGNSMNDDTKTSYPISKVALSKDLATEGGLKFSYLEMSAGTFKNDIMSAYGNELRDNGLLDYDLDPTSEEFLEEVRLRLARTIIKVHGGTKTGFNSPIKEYSFFSFDNQAIASASAPGERELIVNYTSNDQIMLKVSEFIALFDSQVDSLIQQWTEKDLQEYYNSARGFDIHASLQEVTNGIEQPAQSTEEPVQEKIEFVNQNQPAASVQSQPQSTATVHTNVVTQAAATVQQPVQAATTVQQPVQAATQVLPPVSPNQSYNPAPVASDADMEELLKGGTSGSSDADLEEYEYDIDDGDFFEQ